MSPDVPRLRFSGEISYRLRNALSLAVECQEKLSQCYLSQLETCFQCRSDDVFDSNVNAMVEGVR